jgi:mannose/fructose/N-acetylgalactosamine-specific phosphotransferase system component IIB
MPVVLARIDQRLVHGQVLASEALASFKINGVIIADGPLSEDYESQRIFSSALKAADVEFTKGPYYFKPELLAKLLLEIDEEEGRYLLLFRDARSALQAVKSGISLESLNLGNYNTSSKEFFVLFSSFRVDKHELLELNELSEKIPRLYFGSLYYDKHQGSRLYSPKKEKVHL